MSRKQYKQFTEREAKVHAGDRMIVALSNNPMTYAAAIKRIHDEPEGFLIWIDTSGRHLPAKLGQPRPKAQNIQFIKQLWALGEQQGWDGPGWYFWDEVQQYCHGPFNEELDAKIGLSEYMAELG